MSATGKRSTLPGKIIRRTFVRGPLDTTRWLWSHVWSRYREWSLGVETSSRVDADELGFDAECYGYEPISYSCFAIVMKNIEVKADSDVFLDYGSGKGRAVILAATEPFRKVIGVELSDELCRIARDNVRRAGTKLSCHDVKIVNADACEYELNASLWSACS